MSKIVAVAPVSLSERIASIDILRGFAVLGILIMNIQGFAMIEAAYFNPTAYGDLTGLNKWIWIISHVFADMKFMTIFSILFGAGIVLMTQKAETKGIRSGGLHYRRTLWLFIIGLIHSYIFWYGDILVPYALCAVLVFLFRKISPKKLLILGLIVISIASLFFLLFGLTIPQWPPEAIKGNMQSWKPDSEYITSEIEAYQGGWLDQMSHRVPASIMMQTFIFFIYFGWRAGGLMLIGMALFKWGVLTSDRSNKFYIWAVILGYGIGIPVVVYGIVRNFAAGWTLEFSRFLGWQFNYWGSLFVAFGHISVVMLFCKAAVWERFKRLFAAVGRMALTNYLLQSIICTTIFYGHGFGLFGQVERIYQIVILFGVWGLLLVISPLWLRYFRFGPAEWLWRSLTYLKLQPMRK